MVKASKKQLAQRHIGLELGGPRSGHTFLSSLDVYPGSHRCVLSKLEAIKEDHDPDQPLIQALIENSEFPEGKIAGAGVQAPLSFPPLWRKILGAQLTQQEKKELKWMKESEKELQKKVKVKAFIPYLHRPTEIYLRHFTRERFPISDFFSSSGALLAARLLSCRQHVKKIKFHEVYVRGSVVRICQSLNMPKFVENNYSHLTSGVEARYEFFQNLQEKVPSFFFYDEHLELLTMNIHAFNSFMCALSHRLYFCEVTEKMPQHFPNPESWVLLPKKNFNWSTIFKS